MRLSSLRVGRTICAIYGSHFRGILVRPALEATTHSASRTHSLNKTASFPVLSNLIVHPSRVGFRVRSILPARQHFETIAIRLRKVPQSSCLIRRRQVHVCYLKNKSITGIADPVDNSKAEHQRSFYSSSSKRSQNDPDLHLLLMPRSPHFKLQPKPLGACSK